MLTAQSVTFKLLDGFLDLNHQSLHKDSHVTQNNQPCSLTLLQINLEILLKKFSVSIIAYIKKPAVR